MGSDLGRPGWDLRPLHGCCPAGPGWMPSQHEPRERAILMIHAHAQAATRPVWRTVNITPAERASPIAIGLAAVIAGAVLLASAGSELAVVLDALLVAAG